ncbi:MAG: GNAT family N-acetyltransferase [Hyphomicrobiaceae bacterium]|nr:GNAT family N-acetyltransferase [Hyphomicrobiaceae bacterium]
MGDAEQVLVRVEPDITTLDATQWDACANPSGPQGEAARPYNPFISHAFLAALEESRSASAETGWAPRHLVLDDGCGGMLACMPCYLKSHSQGEYVFDYGWADAFERAGGRYYPKLQAAVPFTPVTGRRLLVPDVAQAEERETYLLNAAATLLDRQGASSLHLTFLTQGEWERAGTLGLLRRTDQQFHWQNQGYGTFDDFLCALTSRKRKLIRRERRDACKDEIVIRHYTGSEITEAHWDAFFSFYLDTGSRKWGQPYLNRAFFSLIGQTMADRILLIMCERNGQPIAGALNFIGDDTLYGRYWGCIEDHRFLHFEACYYQAIEFAIAHGLSCVEAGAQGPHKLARGYVPQTTYSAHLIADPSLRSAVARFLAQERRYVEMENEELTCHAPYRRTSGMEDDNDA